MLTADQWSEAADPQWLFEIADVPISARKVRLFAVACCRTIPALLSPILFKVLSVAERHADRLADDSDLRWAVQQLFAYERGKATLADGLGAHSHIARAIHSALFVPSLKSLYSETSVLPAALIPYSSNALAGPFDYAIHTSIHMAAAVVADAGLSGTSSSQDDLIRETFSYHAHVLRSLVGDPTSDLIGRVDSVARSFPGVRLEAAQIYGEGLFSGREYGGYRSPYMPIGAEYSIPRLAQMLADCGLNDPELNRVAKSHGTFFRGHWLLDAALGLG